MAARKGVVHAIKKLKGPPISDDARQLWHRYLALQRWRGASSMGMSPITLHDIDAYERRYGEPFTSWETDVMKTIDLAFLASRGA